MRDAVLAEAKRLGVGDLFAAPAARRIVARYDAAGTGRRMVHWQPPSSGPNIASAGAPKVRDRARDSVRNDWAGASASSKWKTALIGVGITPRFKRITDRKRRQYVRDLYERWVHYCDADGTVTYYGQQTLSVGAQFDSGDAFILKRPRPLGSRWEVPLQIQLIEGDQVPHNFDADTWPGLPQGNTIRRGIERNRYGERTAVWMYRQHPGDGLLLDVARLVRVPIEDVSHFFEPQRIGQLRGVSEMASILTRLRNAEDLDDAVRERQKLANLFAMFVTRAASDDGTGDIDPLTNLPIETDDDGPIARLEPGLSMELDPGQDVKFANPPEAGTMYSEYMRTTHMASAAGLDLPYELFAGDIKEVSDRTLRVIINEFRRRAEQRQWQTVIPKFCRVTIGWFADAALLAGLISREEADAVRMAEWAPHGWAHIHPVQDPQGKILEIDAGLRSRSSTIGERGDDPEAVDDERADDKQREIDLDLWVDPAAKAAKPDVDTDDVPPGEYPQPKKAKK
jgi:lambda family phage portal protein